MPPTLLSVQRESTEVEDVTLLRRVSIGDRRAFEQLYLRYHRRLCRFLMRFGQPYELVEEIINDTMYIVWKKASDFRGQSQVSTWVIGIAYRRALKTFKRNDSHARSDVLDMGELHANADVEAEQERAQWLARGLAQLPLEQRMVLEMAYFLGHSCKEMAAALDCPVNTVKTRMFHARRRLKELLPVLAEPTTGGSGD